MTDELPTAPDSAPKPAKKQRGKAFSRGFDPRRHLLGRGKLSPEQKEGAAILNAVIWKELNREHDAATLKPLDAEETITALELMVRNMIRKKPDEITARIAGKVTDKVEVNQTGTQKVIIEYIDSEDTTAPPTLGAEADQIESEAV